ncbi:hypothetical protein [Psychroserpens mesophilus]|uniref:hypothetical protein n=1 Tax=Psychroserpens mesophilus TaxID=325473 RepID=UPI003D658981
MKLIATIVTLCLCTITSFAQQSLDLKIKEGSDKPNSEKEHLYLLEVNNASKSTATFTISTSNISCLNMSAEKQTTLIHKALSKTTKGELTSYSIKPNSSYEFYIKITRPNNTSIGKWNCTEVKAIDENGKTISNPVVITSLIPDPKDQH